MRSRGQQAVSCEACPSSFSKKVIACTHRRYKHIGQTLQNFERQPQPKPNMLAVPRLLNRSGLTLQRQGCISEPHSCTIYPSDALRIHREAPDTCPDRGLRNVCTRAANFGHGRCGQQGQGIYPKVGLKAINPTHRRTCSLIQRALRQSPHIMQINFWTTFIWILVTAHVLCCYCLCSL